MYKVFIIISILLLALLSYALIDMDRQIDERGLKNILNEIWEGSSSNAKISV